VELTFPVPCRPVSENDIRGKHWGSVRRLLNPWKEAARMAWQLAPAAERAALQDVPCDVEVVIPFRTAQRRDPSNYVDTVVKAIVDGLVSNFASPHRGAKKVRTWRGVWDDDDPATVTVLEPVCIKSEGDVIVRLIPREVAEAG